MEIIQLVSKVIRLVLCACRLQAYIVVFVWCCVKLFTAELVLMPSTVVQSRLQHEARRATGQSFGSAAMIVIRSVCIDQTYAR